jgi:hypothetical protein
MAHSRKGKVKGVHQHFFTPCPGQKVLSHPYEMVGMNIGEGMPFGVFHMDWVEKEIRKAYHLLFF